MLATVGSGVVVHLPHRRPRYRAIRGAGIDLVVGDGAAVRVIEVKSGATTAGDWFDGLTAAADRFAGEVEVKPTLVYGGERRTTRRGVDVLPWTEVGRLAR